MIIFVFGLLQGATDHHENNKIAYKWADETATTKFREIELNTTRTGMVSLTALFDKVIIDSTEVSRASVHNYDIFQEFQFGEGDDITVYKANKIIPQIEENLTRSGTYQLPHVCPCCDTDLEIRQPKDARFFILSQYPLSGKKGTAVCVFCKQAGNGYCGNECCNH